MMIATVGPADYNISETTDTLRYAERAKSIKNKPRVNEDPKDAMIREFQSEIDRLRKQLESQQAGGAAGGSGANPEVYEQQLREREEEHKRRMAEIVAQQAQLAEQEVRHAACCVRRRWARAAGLTCARVDSAR